jgi:hypothetical protein
MPLKTKPATTSGIQPTIVNRRQVSVANQPPVLIEGFGNVTARDMVIPRLKLLQGLSPEVKEDPRTYIQGEWFHTILGDMLGKSLGIVPLQVQRSLELWAPRDDDRGLLARSLDGQTWATGGNTKHEVRIGGRKVIWDTMDSVGESGLAEFGTSKPGDPKSPPAAALTYRLALYLLEHEEISPALYIASRMATRPLQDLITRVQARHMGGTPFYQQQYTLDAILTKRGPNEFFTPKFKNAGNVTEREKVHDLKGLAEAMATLNVRTEDDRPEEDAEAAQGPSRASHKAY